MAAIIGDAKIKVVLDTEDAKRQVEGLSSNGPGGGGGSGGGSGRSGRRSSSNDRMFTHLSRMFSEMPLEEIEKWSVMKHHMSIFNPARTAAPGTGGEALMGGLKVAAAAYVLKQVVDGVEQSPKFVAFVKGLIGVKEGLPIADYLSDEITRIKARLDSFAKTANDTTEMGRASLRLGQHPTFGGALDFWSFMLNMNERVDLMNRRVEKELDKEVFNALGESMKAGFNR